MNLSVNVVKASRQMVKASRQKECLGITIEEPVIHKEGFLSVMIFQGRRDNFVKHLGKVHGYA